MSSKYRVELHYQVDESGLSVFRTDTFFFTPEKETDSGYEKDQRELALRRLNRFMRKPKNDGSIYIHRIEHDGVDNRGLEQFKYIPLVILKICNGAVSVLYWLEKFNQYSSGTAMSPENGIQKLKETLEIW